ncbi:hypothetical protein [Thiolapillus sp.]|uniref:hypothetical protein n=1 Tax=Thiolapillus sp. TaxID=2017437 RepID=UPI0025EF88D8|nr:hypothetical protein [Thiolapillus sp.]
MTRTAGAQIGCQRPGRLWGLGCPKIYHEVEDTLEYDLVPSPEKAGVRIPPQRDRFQGFPWNRRSR